MTDISQDWWFKSSIIYEDKMLDRVGILTENPQSTLDVNGVITSKYIDNDISIYTSNVIATELISSNVIASNVITTNILTTNAYASNVVSSNVVATDFLEGKVMNAVSNIYWDGHSLYDPCPADDGSWSIVPDFSADLGLIHYSWLRRPVSAETIFEDIWQIANAGIDLFNTLNDLWGFMNGDTFDKALTAALPAAIAAAAVGGATAGALASALTDALTPSFDEDSGASNQIHVAWKNVKNKPVATAYGGLGLSGHVYVNQSYLLKSLPNNQFGTDAKGNSIITGTSGLTDLINFGSKICWFNQFVTPNITLSNNLITFSNTATMRTTNNGYFSFNSNTLAYGSISGSNVDLKLGMDSAGALSLYKGAKVFGSTEPFNGSNNYSRFECSLSNGMKYGLGFTSSNINDIFTVSSAGNISTIGTNITFSNIATIQANQKGTEWVNGKSWDAYGLATVRYDSLNYGQILVDQQYPQSNSVSPVFNVSRSNGISMYGRTALLGSNENFNMINPQDPLGSNIALSNYSRLEYGLSNGFRWGYGYCNSALLNNYDVLKCTHEGVLYTLDSLTMTLVPLTDQFGSIVHDNFKVFKDGVVLMGNLRIDTTGSIFWGLNNNRIKKIFNGQTGKFLANSIDFNAPEIETVTFNPVGQPPINPFFDVMSY